MTNTKIALSKFRLTRRRLMLASAAGATLIGADSASAAPPNFNSKTLMKAFATIANSCDRALAMIGYKTTVNELLGKNGTPFVKLLKSGLVANGAEVTDAQKKLVNKLIAELEKAQSVSAKTIRYADFYTKSPSEWGGSHSTNILKAMEAGDTDFVQPHLLHETDTSSMRTKSYCYLYGWPTTAGKRAAGFVELCGTETVSDAFNNPHVANVGREWIDHHLFPWLVKHNVVWSSKLAFLRADKTTLATAVECTKTPNSCTAYNETDGYFCVPGHSGKWCKLDANGQPCLGADMCEP